MKIVTMINFREHISIANVVGGGVHGARAHVQTGKAPLP